jgi:hypothetical protein
MEVKDDLYPSADGIYRLRANYFVRHWNGELSLPVSYWVNFVFERDRRLCLARPPLGHHRRHAALDRR